MFVNVLLNTTVSKLDRMYTYYVPDELEKNIKFGIRVSVPFGNGNRQEAGLVLETNCQPNIDKKYIKQIIDILDKEPIISKFNFKLANWISKRYICNLSDAIRLMLPPGITKTNNTIKKTKIQEYIALNDDIEIDIENMAGLTAKRKEVLELLLDVKYISKSDLYEYFNISSQFLKWFEKNNLINIQKEEIYRDPFKMYNVIPDKPLDLTKEQEEVFNCIKKSVNSNEFKEYLIHGVTGSGKTEVYMHVIDEIIKNGKKVILLVPEIGLTPQMVNRFLSRFGNTIAILHSRLSMGEKIDEYNRIKRGEANIIIGARSAIFAPISNIGGIIIDEEHDDSYKSEMTPKYDAREVAKKICEYNKCILLYGSATPDISTYNKAKEGNIQLLELTKRANNAVLPDIEFVDLIQNGLVEKSKCISNKLFNEIEEKLNKKEQVILFLNKRGYSSSIVCTNCGYIYKCPNCDISLTYHKDKHRFMCHYCGFNQRFDMVCPECGSKEFTGNVLGTQKIEQEIKMLFPNASVIRMDKDTTNGKNGHLEIIEKFKNENIDILIGTQMIAKGHDFPNVTLVGVLNADMSLLMQDYRTNEITFDLLTQVAGRAGRKDKKGKVIIQTYQITNSIFEYIKSNDYKGLYEAEIGYRKLLTYPPFCDIIQITLSNQDEYKVIDTSKILFDYLKQAMKEFTDKNEMLILSPMQAPLSRIDKNYRYKIIIKCKYNEKIANKLKQIMLDEKLNKKVNISIDINSSNNR